MTAVAIAVAWAVVATLAALVLDRRHGRERAAWAEERRFYVNHALASSPTEFATLSAASRPDETVIGVAEAKALAPKTVRPGPLGL